MILKLYLFLILLGIFQLGLGQTQLVSGKLIDEITGDPVPDAHIMLPAGTGVVTNTEGLFQLEVKKAPFSLRITHVSYGQTEIHFDQLPQATLILRIQKMISHVGEVQVTAERLRILTEKEDFSLQDFAFDHQFLWMLGYTNNQANRGKLFLANEYGDTLASVRVKGAEQLYKDVFGDVHLILRDSAIQLFSPDSASITFLYTIDKKTFLATMEPILSGFSNKLVYRNVIPHNEEVYLYYYSDSTLGPQFLTHIVDSLEALRKKLDKVTGSMWLVLKSTRYWMPNTKIARIYDDFVRTPLFSLNDSLYIVNSVKDSLLIYDQYAHFTGSLPINFHKDSSLGDIDHKEFNFLPDNRFGKVYLLERKFAAWSLCPLDHHTGKVLPKILLPDFAGMTGITVYNNAVFFLYHEKKHPYYTRLYRYQL
ncbi:MAG: hypothetical protein HOK84_10590 [Bacteroidetes bacterium]|nr:hypothetical protein [Bacteroidota bacterium]